MCIKITKKHLGDMVYHCNEFNEYEKPIDCWGCYYNWGDVRAGELWTGQTTSDCVPINGAEQSSPTDLAMDFYEVKSIPGKDGMVATLPISRGTRLLAEKPLFRLPGAAADSTMAEALILARVKGPSHNNQRAFLSIEDIHRGDGIECM
ncbi:hypothetical protein OQA88_4647 [Cercophora sp. LCS_1]